MKNKIIFVACDTSSLEEIKKIIKERSKIYSKAQFKINCNKLTKNEIVKSIIKIYELI